MTAAQPGAPGDKPPTYTKTASTEDEKIKMGTAAASMISTALQVGVVGVFIWVWMWAVEKQFYANVWSTGFGRTRLPVAPPCTWALAVRGRADVPRVQLAPVPDGHARADRLMRNSRLRMRSAERG